MQGYIFWRFTERSQDSKLGMHYFTCLKLDQGKELIAINDIFSTISMGFVMSCAQGCTKISREYTTYLPADWTHILGIDKLILAGYACHTFMLGYNYNL